MHTNTEMQKCDLDSHKNNVAQILFCARQLKVGIVMQIVQIEILFKNN
jgi:hypothetical protein